jgi:hypothetical protein
MIETGLPTGAGPFPRFWEFATVFSGWRGPDDVYVRVDDPVVNLGALVAAGYRPYLFAGKGKEDFEIVWSTSPDLSRYGTGEVNLLRIVPAMINPNRPGPSVIILIDEQDGGFINRVR